MKLSQDQKGYIAGIALILFALVMGGFQWALGHMDETFRNGFIVGMLFGAGFIALASRRAREAP